MMPPQCRVSLITETDALSWFETYTRFVLGFTVT
jgi:hypothetical protein